MAKSRSESVYNKKAERAERYELDSAFDILVLECFFFHASHLWRGHH